MLIACSLGRHSWKEALPFIICGRCRQIERFHRDIYGEVYKVMESEGSGIRIGSKILLGTVVIIVALFALLDMGLSEPANGEVDLVFAGKHWKVKSTSGPAGPGPNYFSSNNVWVDGSGSLHLKIERAADEWTTAEIISEDSFGYGTYSVTLGPVAGRLSDQIVLGVFTWDESPKQNHREIDMELRRTGTDGQSYPGVFAVQPSNKPGNLRGITVEPSAGSEFSFSWSPEKIEFFVKDPQDKVVQYWLYLGPDIPTAGNENFRINLWLNGGIPPEDLEPVEVTISDFSFERSSPTRVAGNTE